MDQLCIEALKPFMLPVFKSRQAHDQAQISIFLSSTNICEKPAEFLQNPRIKDRKLMVREKD